MRKTAKSILLPFLAAAVIMSALSAAPAFAAEHELTLYYDGKTVRYTAPPITLLIDGTRLIDLTMPPVIIDDYTLVPAREVFEYMGADVLWVKETEQIIITYQGKTVTLQINNSEAAIDRDVITMPIPPKNINDKTMIPLRFVADRLGFAVHWDSGSRVIYIDSVPAPAPVDITVVPDGVAEYVPADYTYFSGHYSENGDGGITINRNISLSFQENIIPAVDISASELTEEEHPETTVTHIIEPESDGNIFTIVTSSPISKAEKNLLADNRMYIDIYGAQLVFPEAVLTYGDNPNVSSVRAAQNQTEPEMIVRIVFYLKNGAEFEVAMSEDRQALTVGFPDNRIVGVAFDTDAGKDAITITGLTTPGVSIWPASETRLVIDIPFAEIDRSEFAVRGEFANYIITEQNGETARIAVDLNKKAGYNVSTTDNTAVVALFTPTQKNIEYDYDNRRIVIDKTPGVNINISSLIHTDNYHEFEYIITFPFDISDYLGSGEVYVGDDRMRNFVIETENGQTSIIINETRIFAYNVYEDSAHIFIHPILPKEKYDRIVILDAGHGGSDRGAADNGIVESELNLDIVLRLHELLERDARVKVYATRLTDVYPSLGERVQFAAENGDLFVSVHNNHARNREASGIETFYYARPFDDYIGISGERVATILQSKLVEVLGGIDRGVKTEAFTVISASRVPSALVEIGFLSNRNEAALLATSEYRTLAALALYAGIMEIFEIYQPPR